LESEKSSVVDELANLKKVSELEKSKVSALTKRIQEVNQETEWDVL
jgi:hypothetical protein